MNTTQTQESPIRANCANCPYFQDFGETNGRGLCQLFDKMARRHHLKTGDCDQEIEAVESAQQPAPPPTPQPKQPGGLAGDSIGCQLQPTNESPIQLEPEQQPSSKAQTEFDIGSIHGRNDALAGWHPIYSLAVTEYSRGYLAGHNAVVKPTDQQQVARKPLEWSVSLDPRWELYQVWVKDRCIGQAATHLEAERMAQKYVATDEMIRRQNQAVIKAYAVTAIATPRVHLKMQAKVTQKYASLFDQMSFGGKLELIKEILGHRQQALDDATKTPGKVYLRAPAYSLCDEEGMDAFLRKVNSSERQYGSSSNQQKSLLASALINDKPVPKFPELAKLSARAKNNLALSLIGVAATNIREKEQAESEQPGIVKFHGAPHPHILKDDGLREKMIALGFADDARQESLGMQMVNAYLLRAFQN